MPNAPTVSSYDLFLSYNAAHHGVVEDVARRLRAEGLELFLPIEQKNIPLVVFVQGGGWEHGDKAGAKYN